MQSRILAGSREEFREGTIYKAVGKSKCTRTGQHSLGLQAGGATAGSRPGGALGWSSCWTYTEGSQRGGRPTAGTADRQTQQGRKVGTRLHQTNRNGGAGEPTVEMSPGGTRGLWRSTRKHQTCRQLPQLSPTGSDQWVMLLSDNLPRKHGVQHKSQRDLLSSALSLLGVHSVNGSAPESC